ncbi:hypothetical protein M501DRAFT_1001380 [Patellaria atrata CBS 101060]|uniref:Uncharacterized protein n=1 Tax=Patellaria atrata CBS 101060 TaxID=1346257 RepID=A0A9P4VLJ9_9PEZI|nr:hypothetical protein M501DRAFT_1001380 [Patellaria atrata CBS 101060]
MASASPSEFLIFYRTVTTSSRVLRRSTFSSSPLLSRIYLAARPFSSTHSKTLEQDHVMNKKDRLDPEAENAGKGQDAKSASTGGTATEQKDNQNSVERAKRENPEAPAPAIGMQDERGGKGS